MKNKIFKNSIVKILVGVLLINMIPINLTLGDIQISNILKVKADNTNIPISADITWGDTYWEPDGILGQNFVGNYTDGGLGEKTALRFDLSSLANVAITKAEVRFTIVSKNGTPYVDIFKSTDDTTWSGATGDIAIPNNTGAMIIDHASVPAQGDEASYDITNYIKEEYAGDKTVTLILSGMISGDNDFGFGTMGNTDLYSTAYLYLEYNNLISLSQVAGVALSSEGVATWNDVDNESGYSIQLLKNGSSLGTAVTESANTVSHDFLSAIRAGGVGAYTITVTAKGDNITYLDGAVSAASGNQTVTKLLAVSSGLTWASDIAHWSSVSATSYDVQLYKDGGAVGSAKNVLEANVTDGADFSTEIANEGGGTYTYKVTAKGDNKLILDADQSTASNNNIKAKQLTQVSTPSFSDSGVATWTDVSNASSYEVQLYKDGVAQGSAVTAASGATGYDFISSMRSAGAGAYTVNVTAKGDGTYYSAAAPSAVSASQTIIQLTDVSTGLNWSGDEAHWGTVPNAVSYDVQLYQNGSTLVTTKNVLAADASSGTDFTTDIAGAGYGSFTYKVTAKGNSTLILDASQSPASDINLKATPLEQVTNVALSSLGVASWTATPNATSYTVKLYKGGSYTGDSLNTASTSISVLSNMRAKDVGVYTVKITAIGDHLNFSDGTESAASTSQTITKLNTATGLTWTADTAHWSGVTNAVSYDVQLYKDGGAVSGALVNVLEANQTSGVDFSSQIASNGGGTYTYKITAKGDSVLLFDADQSAASSNNIKAIQLAQVTNVSLSALGVASWDNIDHEHHFSIQLYKDGGALGSPVSENADVLSHNFLAAMRAEGVGTYTVKVTAIGDGTYYTDGLQAAGLSSQTVSKLSTATSLTWIGNVAHFSAVTNASSYEVQLYKGGSAVVGAVKTVNSSALAAGADFSTEIASAGAGTYTFTVTAKGDGALILDGLESLPSLSKIVATPLSQVTGVTLSATGTASWNNVLNETKYSVQLYKDGSALGSEVFKNADILSHDFLAAMRSAGAGIYTVKVTAIGDDVNYSNGLQSTASVGQTIVKLATVGGLTWVGDTAHFNTVSNAVSYEVQLYKSGIAQGLAKTITAANASLGVDFSSSISTAGVGSYTFKVTAKGDSNLILDGNTSNESGAKVNTVQLSQVTGVTLSDTGVASWNNVSNETKYLVQLYKDGNTLGSAVMKDADTLSHDFLTAMRSAGTGVYTVKVTAKGDGVYYLDGAVSAASQSKTVTKLATVDGLTWVGDTAHFNTVLNAVSYEVQLYKSGTAQGLVKTITAANASLGADFSSEITASGVGNYTFKVTAKGNNNLILDANTSSESVTNVKTIQLSQVTGVTLSDSGVASWNNVSNETKYLVQLYKDGNALGSAVMKDADTFSHDFLTAMRSAGAGVYTVKVTAKGDGVYYLDGALSVASQSQTMTKLATVANGLTWNNTIAKWTPVAYAVSYEVQLYKNDNSVGSPVAVSASNADSGVDFNKVILLNGFGTYTYKVLANGNSALVLDAEQSSFSNDYIKQAKESSATFDKKTNSKNNKKISVELLLDTSLLKSIKNGSNKLKAKEDYTVAGNVVTISKDYLKALKVGSSTLTIAYKNDDKQTITIKVVDTTKDSTKDTTQDTSSDSSTTNTGTNQTPKATAMPPADRTAETNSQGNNSEKNTKEAENGADSNASQNEAEGLANQQNSGDFEVKTETSEGTPTFSMPSDDELYDAVLTEEDKAAIKAGEKVSVKVVIEAVEEPEDGNIVKENLGENTFGMYLDISVLKTVGTQQSEVHELNQPITLTFDIPDNLKGKGKYAIIRVHNGETAILEDEDDNPDTITFSTDRCSTYALVYEEADDSISAASNVTPAKGNLIILWMIAVAILIAGGAVVVILKKRNKAE